MVQATAYRCALSPIWIWIRSRYLLLHQWSFEDGCGREAYTGRNTVLGCYRSLDAGNRRSPLAAISCVPRHPPGSLPHLRLRSPRHARALSGMWHGSGTGFHLVIRPCRCAPCLDSPRSDEGHEETLQGNLLRVLRALRGELSAGRRTWVSRGDSPSWKPMPHGGQNARDVTPRPRGCWSVPRRDPPPCNGCRAWG